MHSIILKIIFLAVWCVTLAACPSKNKSPERTISKTIIMGDPKKIIEGASLNAIIPNEFFVTGKPVYLYSLTSFVQKQDVTTEKRDLEAEEAAPSDEEASSLPSAYTMSVENNLKKLILSLSDNLNSNLDQENVIISIDKLNFATKIQDNDSTINGRLLHTSLSNDGNILSLLIYQEDYSEGQSVLALYFSKVFDPQYPPQISKDYFYITGPGQQVLWPKTRAIQLDICGPKSLIHSKLIDEQAAKWSIALTNQIKFQTIKSENYKPFSDLNQHCLYIVDDFMTEPSSQYLNYGLTLSIIEHNKAQIIDSDIMLFTKEFHKTGFSYDSSNLSEKFLITVLHEMGHFLGLDHQFTGVKSIMSYDLDTTILTNYDKSAVRELYKRKFGE